MPKSTLTLSFHRAFAALAAAARAGATEARRLPHGEDLKTPSIDETTYRNLQL